MVIHDATLKLKRTKNLMKSYRKKDRKLMNIINPTTLMKGQ